MKFSGIDLHSNNCFVVIIDEADRIMYGRRLPNKLSGILAALAPYRDELDGVVVESTYNWYWLVDGLMAAGYPVHLANTAAIKKYDGFKHSGDEADAVHLAHLLRLGILPTGHTSADVVLLAATDTLHGTLSGLSTKKLMERAYRLFTDARYERVAVISVAHLYNLRKQSGYQRHRRAWTQTRPVTIAIGERRAPAPNNQPGYPKSRASNLYREEIVLESSDGKEVEGRVVFCAFSGIAPRQYRQLFAMSERGKKKGKSLSEWQISRTSLSPRYVMHNASRAYLAAERQELEKLLCNIYRWDKDTLCP